MDQNGLKLRTRVFVYLDDRLILSDDFESHMKLIEEVAEYFRKANLSINIAKTQFCMKEIRYTGFIIGERQLIETRSQQLRTFQATPEIFRSRRMV